MLESLRGREEECFRGKEGGLKGRQNTSKTGRRASSEAMRLVSNAWRERVSSTQKDIVWPQRLGEGRQRQKGLPLGQGEGHQRHRETHQRQRVMSTKQDVGPQAHVGLLQM